MIAIFLLYSVLLLNLLTYICDYMFPSIKENKIRALVAIGDEIQKQNSNLNLRLAIYVIDCGVGREKVSYTSDSDISKIMLRKEYGDYNCYVVNNNNKIYINIEKNTCSNQLIPFFDFWLYSKLGKSFAVYIKTIVFYIISFGLCFAVYKPYIDYNKKVKQK